MQALYNNSSSNAKIQQQLIDNKESRHRDLQKCSSSWLNSQADDSLFNTDKNEVKMFPNFRNTEINKINIPAHGYEQDRRLTSIRELHMENDQIQAPFNGIQTLQVNNNYNQQDNNEIKNSFYSLALADEQLPKFQKMSPQAKKLQEIVFNPESYQSCDKPAIRKMSVGQFKIENKTERTSNLNSDQSLSPDSRKSIKQLEKQDEAKKVLFDDLTANDGASSPINVPTYRQLTGRNTQTLFYPKKQNIMNEDFNLNRHVMITARQEAIWTNQLERMVQKVKDSFQQQEPVVQNASEVGDIEKLIMSDEFFSFDQFQQSNKKVLRSYKKPMYKSLAKQTKTVDFNYFDLDQEVQSDSAIQPSKPSSSQEVTISKPVEMTISAEPFNKKMSEKKHTKKKNDLKENLTRQTKYFDHAKYHDVPKANDIPMDLFD